MSNYPLNRIRRLRSNKALRSLVRETQLSTADLIMPCFVIPGEDRKEPVEAMPGVARLSIDNLIKLGVELIKAGIPGILLFGIPQHKTDDAASSWDENGIVPKAVESLKKEVPDLAVITDVCVCSYTSHGHCGIVKDGQVDNDRSLGLLAKMALAHARSGADMVAPSAMMDGQVKAIREILDKNKFEHTPVMGYSAKYSSAFYGPFRDVADSTPEFGDRNTYQMDPANSAEALREVKQDIAEGADIVMVKPALSYLDMIYKVKNEFNYPVAAYNVSGEYSMIKAAHKAGWVDERKVALEVLTSIKRAGADIILTYYALQAAKWLK